MAATSAHRPLVQVYAYNKEEAEVVESLTMPAVLLAPIRSDIVHFVHTNMAKNARQPYAVNRWAGSQTSADSWGTGRAVARIPRVSGSGTHRSGQGAFGNMCRKGRMFAPTKTWRRWHHKINQNQRRFAMCSALAATALPSLIMARGHKIDDIPEIPLVINDGAESLVKTANAVKMLNSLAAYEDVLHVKDTRKMRAGKGKMRGRRFKQRRGPLVVYDKDEGIFKAMRNTPGVELCNVTRLNVLQLAPGGHLGRFVIWTRSAFAQLDKIYGTPTKPSEMKKDYVLPRPMMTMADLARIINSDEIQSKLRPAKEPLPLRAQKKNPLKNLNAMVKLNPLERKRRRQQLISQLPKEKKPRSAEEKAVAATRRRRSRAYRRKLLD